MDLATPGDMRAPRAASGVYALNARWTNFPLS